MLHERSKGVVAASDSPAPPKKPKLSKAEILRKRKRAREYYREHYSVSARKKKGITKKTGGVSRGKYLLATRLRRLIGEALRDGEPLNDIFITAFMLTEEVLKDG